MKAYDQIDIIFIVLISLYLVVLFAIVCVLVYGKKDEKPLPKRYKVIQIISPKKEKKSKYKGKKKPVSNSNNNNNNNNKTPGKQPQKSNNNKKKTNNNKNNNQNKNNYVRYKGNAPTKKKPQARKKYPKTNGKNKKK